DPTLCEHLPVAARGLMISKRFSIMLAAAVLAGCAGSGPTGSQATLTPTGPPAASPGDDGGGTAASAGAADTKGLGYRWTILADCDEIGHITVLRFATYRWMNYRGATK